MQNTIRVLTFLVVVIGAYLLVSKFLFSTETYSFYAKQGTITIVTTDANSDVPIRNAKYTILDKKTGDVVAEIMTDDEGKAITGPLNYGYYVVQQNEIEQPYVPKKKEQNISLFTETLEFEITNEIPAYVQDFYYTDEGEFKITSVYITVPSVLQLPELPHGCEITSATSILKSYGYNVSKTTMADQYLPRAPFKHKKGKLYGPDPYKAYAGNPRLDPGGFFTYAPPVVTAVNQYLKDENGTQKALDISGSTKEEIFAQLNRGIPVVIWVTLDLSKPINSYSWYIDGTEEKFIAPINLHAVVLHGYDDAHVFAMNPLKGELTYKIDEFFDSYVALGSHAMIIE